MARLGRAFPNNRFQYRRPTIIITQPMAANMGSASSVKATMGLTLGLAAKFPSASSMKSGTPSVVHPLTPTIADILAGVYAQVRWRVRYEILDPDRNMIDELHPTAVGGVTWDPTNRIQRVLDGVKLDPIETLQLTRGVTKIRPVFEFPAVGYERALGTFTYFGGPQRSAQGRTWVDCAPMWDRCYQLEQAPRVPMSAAPAAVLSMVAAQLAADGGISTADQLIAMSTAVLGDQPLAYPVGSGKTRMQFLRQIGSLMSYLPPGFSQADQLVMRPVPQPDGEWPTFVYTDGVNSNVVADSIVEQTSVADLPNVYVVLSAQPSGEPIVGTYIIPPSAENSSQSITFEIVAYRIIDGLPSEQAAKDAAKAWAQQDRAVVHVFEWQTVAEPEHDQWNIVEITNIDATYRLLEFWHHLDLSTGIMSHRAKKVYVDAA